jgi:class 3 adenylate cyclase/pimeloyl-ACP methyl ester carboxylesterase
VEQTRRVQPDIRYARGTDGVAIAYMVVGDAERDLVLVPEFVSNLVADWSSDYWRTFYERLARSFRLILFDKRGTGLSDRGGAGFAALETRMEDMRTVLDAVGSKTAVVFGGHEGGQMAALYAATYPERTDALVLFQFYPGSDAEDPDWESGLQKMKAWGTKEFADQLLASICPTLLRSEEDRVWFANRLRLGATPEIGYQLNDMYWRSDVRAVLPTIRVPTLMLWRGAHAREDLGDAPHQIPDVRVGQIAGEDEWGTFLSPEIVDEIEQFVDDLTVPVPADSMLATILFTDIVDSSPRAAKLGDRRWAELVERHHAAVRAQLRRFRGDEVDTAGDGFFATFDGPARAIHCGVAIRDAVSELDLGVRVGVHTGECVRVGGKPSGIAVSTGARVMSVADAGEVLVSQTVKDLVAGSGIQFEERGVRELKGVPGEWRLYAVA